MAPSKKLSLTSAVWICFFIGGVALSYVPGQEVEPTNVTTTLAHENDTTAEVTVTTPNDTTVTGTTEPMNITTTEPTTQNTTTAASNDTTSTEPPAPQNTTFNPNGTTEANATTEATSPLTSPIVTTPSKTTQNPPTNDSQKFDVASFFGGMATAVGLLALIFIAVSCYTKSKKTRYHAM